MSAPAAGRSSRRWGTWANALTALRFAAVPPLVATILAGSAAGACALFALAVATDLLDGRVARRFGEATPLGGLLDHCADAAFVSAGLGALAWQGRIPAPLPLLVAAAFLQYVLDSRALAGRRLLASGLGRANGIAYFVLLGIPLVRDALGLAAPDGAVVRGLGWVLVATTLLSMAERARRPKAPDSSSAGTPARSPH